MSPVHQMYPQDTQTRALLEEEIIDSFETLRVYCKHLTKVRDNALEELESQIDSVLATDSIDEHHFDDLDFRKRFNIGNFFDQFQWSSALIVSVAQLEILLRKISKSAHQPTDVALDDVRGKGVFQARLFLEKACHADLSAAQEEWEAITNLIKLRNHVVHSSEFFDPRTKNDLARITNCLPGILETEYAAIPELGLTRKIRIRPSQRTLEFSADVFQKFLLTALAAVAV